MVLIYSPIIHANCATIGQLPPFDAVWFDVSDGPSHTFLETCLRDIRANPDTYWMVGVEPANLFTDAANFLESLLPNTRMLADDSPIMGGLQAMFLLYRMVRIAFRG